MGGKHNTDKNKLVKTYKKKKLKKERSRKFYQCLYLAA